MNPIPVQTLVYESPGPDAHRSRPKWVYAIVIVYALLIVGGISAVMIPLAIDGEEMLAPLMLIISVLVVAQVSMIFVPVRVNSRRPFTKRSLWFPLLGSGLLAGVLVLCGGLAVAEWQQWEEAALWAVVAASGLTWLLW